MNPLNLYDDRAAEIREVLAQYELGELEGFKLNERGFVNTSFAIETVKNGIQTRLFLRKYRPGINEEELLFEHTLTNHLTQQGALPVARVHCTRVGRTYLQRIEKDSKQRQCFYAIFDYLSGEDRYTWISPHCTKMEISNAARILALFHSAVSNFQPKGGRCEPKILDLLPLLAQVVRGSSKNSKNTTFDAYLQSSQEIILQSIQDTQDVFKEIDSLQMPQIVIHCDYHPGNLKFQGEEVCGLFDFDWSKVDYRCFDLGLALWYFFVEWEGKQDGMLRLEEACHFLEQYQVTMQDLPGIGPLSPNELRYLPTMINAGNLYVLNWSIQDFFNKNVDPEEYLKFLRHHANFIGWFNKQESQKLVEKQQ